MSEYKAACGCAIHVAQWTAKRKVVSVKNCPLHKAAEDLLTSLKELLADIHKDGSGDDDYWSMVRRAKEAASRASGDRT